jgi:predicted transcriptional regulator
MSNADRFLNAFATIEQRLRPYANGDRSLGFTRLIAIASQSNQVIKYYTNDLYEFAELRNAIVHQRAGGYIIAEPNERAVREIERVANLVSSPPKLIPHFQVPVIILLATDPVSKAVELMLGKSISQIPIADQGKFMGLLTTNTIARWLGSSIHQDIFSLSETSINEVMKYTEDEDNHVFRGRQTPIFDAINLFSTYETQGKRLEALLITEHGQPSEKIIGIMTVFDLPKALRIIS